MQALSPLATFLAARAIPGIEEAAPGGAFRRTVRLAHGPAVVELARLAPGAASVELARLAPGAARVELARLAPGAASAELVRLAHGSAVVELDGAWDPRARGAAWRLLAADPRDRAGAEAAARRLAGSDPSEADAHLAGDPLLGPLVALRPGLRMPGTVDGGELAVRAVLGQQVSLAAARTLAGRLVAAAGEPLPEPHGALTHVWPRPEAIAEAAPRMPMPRARQRTLAALAEALAGGLRLEPGTDPAAARAALLELPGIGPWTAEYVAMRALGDPDAWLPTDLGVRRGLERLGAGTDAAEAWRPHRAHAVRHLWALH